MARIYRHTTPGMLARVVAAVEDRLAVAVPQMCPEGRKVGPGERKGEMR
jgi:hypothetical protein